MSSIAERITQVNENIAAACGRAGRLPDEVKLIIVAKSATVDQIKEVIDLGYCDLGENRVQQLKKISEDLASYPSKNPINWHMIGHLQRNKVRTVLPIVTMIHSVDTLRLAEEINIAAAKHGSKIKILLQVNAAQEAQKYGVPAGAAIHLAEQFETMAHIELCGLMTMGPLTDDNDAVRSCFARMKELFMEIRHSRIVGPSFKHLSMGMSSDYQIAVEEGATILRIGSAIFS